ncbi:endolytic transglycosylase MltG [Thermobrachium celere]|uniref:endolytic transglycosylase MltG n=1 Tax=Thermobrachium celere TaxID=53422 RepID=UPI0019404ADA|nr:endolytic transglycosylase MltG [Thermobrachium celere]GFR36394.1 cell division protein YceG [Thermobrachium celere]
MGKNKKLLIITFIVLAAVLSGVYYLIYVPISKTNNKGVDFRIGTKADVDFVARSLKRKGLVRSYIFTKYYFMINKIKLNVGVYEFNQTMPLKRIFEMINSGETDKNIIMVTIPEGYTVKQIAEKLKALDVIKDVDKFIMEAQTGKFEYEFIQGIKDRPSRLEGYLFPDTYEFKKGMSEHDIINIMLKRFNDIYVKNIKGKVNKDGYTVDEIIIIASIVEREAKLKEERPKVAAVFYNRLKKDIKLESCATIQYILGTPKEKLTLEDLKIESPYNTYKNKGLPIGPICNPGLDSIIAALNPADVDYLYFLVNEDKRDGSHYFTNSYEEFLKQKHKKK